MGSRTWIKVYCEKWLGGTLREDPPDVRGVWIDLLALAGSGQYGDTGEIKLTNGVGLSDLQISQILCIKPSLWRRAKKRFLLVERIKISSKGAISITNWANYQSEYNRQKPYRERKDDTFTPEPESPLTIPLEKEKESEKLQREVTTESYNLELQNIESSTDSYKVLEGENPPLSKPHCQGKRSDTLKARITTFLEWQNHPCSPTEIAHGLELAKEKHYLVNLTLSQNKGKVFVNTQRGFWILKE